MDFLHRAGMRFGEAIFATQKSLEKVLITCVRVLRLFHMATENRLLATLPREVYEKLAPKLKRVSLEQGTILHHPGEAIKDLYFPINCLLSITITMRDGSTAEAGMVGNRDSNTPIVVMAERYGEDMEGKDVKVGESEYVTYLEDGKQ